MPGRSIVNQGALIQRETTPGTAVVNAMKRVLGLRIMPGYTDDGEDFTASGSKVPTSRIYNTELGEHEVNSLQDFNAMTYTLTGGFGAPVTTTPDGVGAPTARLHTYTLNPNGADTLAAFTVMWGDTTQALQLKHFVFTSLGIGIERTSLSLDSAAMSHEPITGIAYPTTGITEVASAPAAGRQWDAFLDTTWAALGTTKLLAAYNGNVNFPDKYSPDWVINSANASFDSLLESEDFSPSVELTLGFDATSVALVNNLTVGTVRFLRLDLTGALIAGTTSYGLELDLAIRITSRGSIATSPAGAVQIPLTAQVTRDPVSGNAAVARLTNVVTGL